MVVCYEPMRMYFVCVHLCIRGYECVCARICGFVVVIMTGFSVQIYVWCATLYRQVHRRVCLEKQSNPAYSESDKAKQHVDEVNDNNKISVCCVCGCLWRCV